jgi:hypothetical protein
MLKNAKKVEKDFVDPLIQKNFNDHIENPYLDEIREGLHNKYSSFQRKNDPVFLNEFGRYYQSFR